MATPLEELGALSHPIDRSDDALLEPPDTTQDRAYRVCINRLAWMQKEALVSNNAWSPPWRISSDEGEYLDSADIAPPPLGNTTAGLTSTYTAAIRDSRLECDDLTVTLDSYYWSGGSRLGGTLDVGALSPDLHVEMDTDVDQSTVREEVERAIERSPIHGLLGAEHTNRFTLTHNGEQIEPGDLPAADVSPPEPPETLFESLDRGHSERDPPIVRHTGERTEPLEDGEERWEQKLTDEGIEQSHRVLHLRGTCAVDDAGLHRIRQETFAPRASIFDFTADETDITGQTGRAPDGLSYLSAAIPFCLTTHLAQIANIEDVEIDYQIIQDGGFSWGDEGSSGSADPLVTHLYLESDADHDFARSAIDFSELACFLHAMCTDVVEPNITVSTR